MQLPKGTGRQSRAKGSCSLPGTFPPRALAGGKTQPRTCSWPKAPTPQGRPPLWKWPNCEANAQEDPSRALSSVSVMEKDRYAWNQCGLHSTMRTGWGRDASRTHSHPQGGSEEAKPLAGAGPVAAAPMELQLLGGPPPSWAAARPGSQASRCTWA